MMGGEGKYGEQDTAGGGGSGGGNGKDGNGDKDHLKKVKSIEKFGKYIKNKQQVVSFWSGVVFFNCLFRLFTRSCRGCSGCV